MTAHPPTLQRRRVLRLCAQALALASLPHASGRAQAPGFDHSHAAWTALLRQHVVLLGGGQASQLRYAAMAVDRAALKAYLAQLSAVPAAAFDAFSKPQQMAFLINAYNAFTVELILTRYPQLESIRDLGGFLSKPWSIRNIPLLGRLMTLDEIEHDTLRARGRYDDPRIHFAVNCASVGCPMLREEAFVAERLEAQLEEQAARFMADRSRNRYSAERGRLEVSKIYDWFKEDFGVREKYFARYANLLADGAEAQKAVAGGAAPLHFLDYDWSLNDAARDAARATGR